MRLKNLLTKVVIVGYMGFLLSAGAVNKIKNLFKKTPDEESH